MDPKNKAFIQSLRNFVADQRTISYSSMTITRRAAAQILEAVDEPNAEIDAAWAYIKSGYDCESREELEQQSRTNGFKYGLAQAMHHIWKRNPEVAPLLDRITILESNLSLAIDTRTAAQAEATRNTLLRREAEAALVVYREAANEKEQDR